MADFGCCPCTGETLDKLIRPAALSVLAAGPLHGYRLVRTIARLRVTRGRNPDATGIYRALRSMQRGGLVVARWDVSGPGPAKHLYRLTPSGRACLRRWVETLRNYGRAVQELLAKARSASRPRRAAPAHRRSRKA